MLEMLPDIVAQQCKDWGGELLDFEADWRTLANQSAAGRLHVVDETRQVEVRRKGHQDMNVVRLTDALIASRRSGPGRTASPHVATHRCQ
jgi:hypothetical protein